MTEEKKPKRSSVAIPGESVLKLNEISKHLRDNKVFDCNQPQIIINLIDKEYKRIFKK